MESYGNRGLSFTLALADKMTAGLNKVANSFAGFEGKVSAALNKSATGAKFFSGTIEDSVNQLADMSGSAQHALEITERSIHALRKYSLASDQDMAAITGQADTIRTEFQKIFDLQQAFGKYREMESAFSYLQNFGKNIQDQHTRQIVTKYSLVLRTQMEKVRKQLGIKSKPDSIVGALFAAKDALMKLGKQFYGSPKAAAHAFAGSLHDVGKQIVIMASKAIVAKVSLYTMCDAMMAVKTATDNMQNVLIDLYRRIDMADVKWEQMHSQLVRTSIDLLASTDDMQEAFSQLSIVQMRDNNIAEFSTAVHKLAKTTGLSASEAGEAMRNYARWYKGGTGGMLGLANAIRYVSTNTKLAASEATGLLNTFVAIAKNIPREFRKNVAPQVLAIGALFREAEAPVQDLENAFAAMTDQANLQGRMLKKFLVRQTGVAFDEITNMLNQGQFSQVADLMMQAMRGLPEEQAKIFRHSLPQLIGVSYDTVRAFQEMSGDQIAQWQKMRKEIEESTKRTKELDEAYEGVRSSFSAITEALSNLVTPVFATFGRILQKLVVGVANNFLIPVLQGVARVITAIPEPLKKMIGLFVIFTGVLAGLAAMKMVWPILAIGLTVVGKAIFFMAKGMWAFSKSALWLTLISVALYGLFKLFPHLVKAGKLLGRGIWKVLKEIGGWFVWLYSKTIAPIVSGIMWIYNKLDWVSKKIQKMFDQTNLGWIPFAGGAFEVEKKLRNIPKAAEGGIVTRPTYLLAGEGGQPEIIVPLDRLEAVMSRVKPEAMHSTADRKNAAPKQTVVVPAPQVSVHLDNKQIADLLGQILSEVKHALVQKPGSITINESLRAWSV